MGRSTKDKSGDCFLAHGNFIFADTKGKYTLCHGTVYHSLTGRHEHCWLEYEEKFESGFTQMMVKDISNGNDVEMPQDAYYRLGKVEDVKRYTRKEATGHMLTHMTYGPWED